MLVIPAKVRLAGVGDDVDLVMRRPGVARQIARDTVGERTPVSAGGGAPACVLAQAESEAAAT